MGQYGQIDFASAKRESHFHYYSFLEWLSELNSFISECWRGMQVRISLCLLPIFFSSLFVAFFAGWLILGTPRCIERGRRVDLDRWRFAPREPRGKGQPKPNQEELGCAVPSTTFWLYGTNISQVIASRKGPFCAVHHMVIVNKPFFQWRYHIDYLMKLYVFGIPSPLQRSAVSYLGWSHSEMARTVFLLEISVSICLSPFLCRTFP